MPQLSNRFQSLQPSGIKKAQMEFLNRVDKDQIKAINTALGSVTLPMHPALQKRLFNLKEGHFANGVVGYEPIAGMNETKKAFLNIIQSRGFITDNLHVQVTDGGSQGMELIITGVCGDPGSNDRPLLLIDPAYSSYRALASRIGRKTVSVKRKLQDDGKFTIPGIEEIEKVIQEHNPGALVIIPYDNPTGQYVTKEALQKLAEICIKHDMWIISDESYRELYYTNDELSSIWAFTNDHVPGIEGRRISLESASKVWSACGLRCGAVVTDNEEFHKKCVAENTAILATNSIGQYIFGAIAQIPHSELIEWYQKQRDYYKDMILSVTTKFKELMPDIIVSSPDSCIYSVLDIRNLVDDSFNVGDFVMYCATKGKVPINGQKYTVLVAPMGGFYEDKSLAKTQMRIAYVAPPDEMKLVPEVFAKLFKEFTSAQ